MAQSQLCTRLVPPPPSLPGTHQRLSCCGVAVRGLQGCPVARFCGSGIPTAVGGDRRLHQRIDRAHGSLPAGGPGGETVLERPKGEVAADTGTAIVAPHHRSVDSSTPDGGGTGNAPLAMAVVPELAPSHAQAE